jgi:hypothetical protein
MNKKDKKKNRTEKAKKKEKEIFSTSSITKTNIFRKKRILV